MTCTNCPQEAVFHVADPGANPVQYCRACLPPHLNGRALNGDFDPPQDEATPQKSK